MQFMDTDDENDENSVDRIYLSFFIINFDKIQNDFCCAACEIELEPSH